MNIEKATARPWRVEPHTGTNDYGLTKDICPCFIEEPEGYRLAYIIGDVEELNPEANAALIVKAVNEYEAHCELEKAALVMRNRFDSGCPLVAKEESIRAFDDALAQLESIRKKEGE